MCCRHFTQISSILIYLHFREKIKLRDDSQTLMHLSCFAIPELVKLLLLKTITKVNQFDSSFSRQEDVVAFDVTMNNPIVVQMLKSLLSKTQGAQHESHY